MKFVFPLALLATLPLTAQTNPTPGNVDLETAASTPPSTNAAPVPAAPLGGDSNTNGLVGPPPPVPPPANLEIPPPALSPDPFTDPLIAKIVVRYQKAWDGDRKETKSLTADLERWSKDEPDNYLLMAYLGSVYALDSRDSWIGPGKIAYLRKADTALDDAVNGDPSNPAIRLLRAMNYYELPAMFGKHRAAHDDFEYLLAQLKGTLPMPFTLSNESRQAIYYYAGLSEVQFSQTSDAKDAWQAGWTIDPKSKLGMKMQAELATLK
jgi:hypothetical protein